MESPFQLKFANEQIAKVIEVDQSTQLSHALHTIGLQVARPTLVLVGGASGINEADMIRLEHLFVEAIAPLAQELDMAVVDGGTDAGIMRLMGKARHEIGGTFPLIGVAAIHTVVLPDAAAPRPDAAPLEPHHSHFVLVPGTNWGDESPWLSGLAKVLSEGFASVTLVVNGGEITFQDVQYSVKASRPAIALDGSGRTADKLAAAVRGEATDLRAEQLAASGQVQALNLSKNPQRIAEVIKQILSNILHV